MGSIGIYKFNRNLCIFNGKILVFVNHVLFERLVGETNFL